jgi:hypothetical protein
VDITLSIFVTEVSRLGTLFLEDISVNYGSAGTEVEERASDMRAGMPRPMACGRSLSTNV